MKRLAGCIGYIPLILFLIHPSSNGMATQQDPPPNPKLSTQISVMSYNIFGLPFPFSVDRGRLRLMGQTLRDASLNETGPSVVGFQEGFRKSTSKLIDAAGFLKFIPGPPKKGTPMSSGLFALTQFAPIVSAQHYYSACGSWDCLNSKGAQHFRFQEPRSGAVIDFYNTHLQADPYNNPFFTIKAATEIRTRQTQELIQFIRDTKDSKSIVLLVGDFNFTTKERGFVLLTKELSLRSALTSCLEDKCSSDAQAQDLNDAIDHQFFLNQSSQSRLAPIEYKRTFQSADHGGKFLSDHLAVQVNYLIF